MAYLALYRKYRPNSFDDVLGQNKVVAVIKNAIINNKVSHAYLFSGPRGTGKTTVAKILARLVNCERLSSDGKPCEKCFNCINYLNSNDIVEIDAASNNGVDEIRELIDKVNLVPSNAKYKIYIIDEVHMLTNQAFNALLKTLEEPPSHVIFVLATTDPQKVPLTISSRCQKFQFSKIDDMCIVERLQKIVALEKINIDEEALFEIARLSDGGMRDAINMLDQLATYESGQITLDEVHMVAGSVSYDNIFNLMEAIKLNNKIAIINFIEEFDKSGKELNKFIQELIVFLKDVILFKSTKKLEKGEVKRKNIMLIDELYNEHDLYNFIEVLNETSNKIKFSSHGSIIFMTTVLKFSDNNFKETNKIISREIISLVETDDENLNEKNISQKIINKYSIGRDEIGVRINNSFATASKEFLKNIKNDWYKIDDYISDDEFSVVSGLLKDSLPVVGSAQYLTIVNKFDSIVERINENITLTERLLKKVFNYDMIIVAINDITWEEEKNKYITNIKKNIKYNIIELPEKEEQKKIKTSIDHLAEMLGEDIIE